MKRLVLPLILLAAPTHAATFAPPTGCTAYLTVQSRGCLVFLLQEISNLLNTKELKQDAGNVIKLD